MGRINANRPLLTTKIAFATDPAGPNAANPSYTDISGYVPQLDTTRGRQYELDQVQAGVANLTLDNADSRFSPTNSSSPYYPNVKAMRPTQVAAVWPWNVVSNPDLASDLSSWTLTANTAPGTFSRVTSLSDTGMPVGVTTAMQYQQSLNTNRTSVLLAGKIAQATDPLPYLPKAGEQWTVSLYCKMPTTNNWQFRVSLANADGTSPVTSQQTFTPTGAWVRYTFTFTLTADATASTCVLLTWVNPNNTMTMQLTGVQLEPRSSASVYGRATVYDLFTGYVERFPQEWEHDAQGWSKVTASDGFSALANAPQLRSALQQSILNLSPRLYYPLGEAAGTTVFADLAGNGAPVARTKDGKYGAGSVSAGNVGPGYPGDDGTYVRFTSSQPGDQVGGKVTIIDFTETGDPSVLPPAQGGFSWWLTFNADAAPASWAASGVLSLLAAGDPTINEQNVWLFIMQDGSLQFQVIADAASSNQTYCRSSFSVLGAGWMDVLCTLAADNQTLTMTINGLASQTYTATLPSPANLNKLTLMQMGGVVLPSGSCGDAFSGLIGHWAELPPDPGGDASTLDTAWRNAFMYDMPGARIGRLLDWAGWPSSLRDLDTGATYYSGMSDIAGNDPLTALLDVATTDGGVFDITGAGKARFRDRASRFQTVAAQCVLGDAGDGVEIPYEGDVAFDFDTTYVYSDVKVTKRDTGAIFAAHNASSEQASFSRELDLDVNLYQSSVATDMANFLGYRYATPRLRVSKVSVECASKPWVFTQMLGLDIGSRVTARKRPPDSSLISTDCYVEQIRWSITASSWRCELLLSPAFDTVWLVGCWHSTLSAASAVGATSITVAALSDAATNPNPASAIGPGQSLMLLDSPVPHGPGEVAVVLGTPTVNGDGTVAIPVGNYYAAVGITNNPLHPSDTVVTFAGAIPANIGWLVIDGEVMPVVSGAGTTSVTVTRGVGATQHAYNASAVLVPTGGLTAAHAAGITVCEYQSVTRDPTTWDAYSTLDSTTRLAY